MQIQAVIAQLAVHDRGLGEVLDALAYNFDYDIILTLIAQSAERRAAT